MSYRIYAMLGWRRLAPPAPEDLTRLLALAHLDVDLADLPPTGTTIVTEHDTEPCPPPEVAEYLARWFPPRPEGGL